MARWLLDAAAGIARSCRALISAGRLRQAVEEDGKLVGDAVLGRAATAGIDQARDIPFVVRAEAEGYGCAQSVIIAKGKLGRGGVLVHRRLEVSIFGGVLVDPGFQRL